MFEYGAQVKVRNSEDDPWQIGIVKNEFPTKVQVGDAEELSEWKYIIELPVSRIYCHQQFL